MNEPMMMLKPGAAGRSQRLFAFPESRASNDGAIQERAPSLGWALLARMSPAQR